MKRSELRQMIQEEYSAVLKEAMSSPRDKKALEKMAVQMQTFGQSIQKQLHRNGAVDTDFVMEQIMRWTKLVKRMG